MNRILPSADLKKLFSFENIEDESNINGIRAKISSIFLLVVSFLMLPVLAGLVFRGFDAGWHLFQILALCVLGFWWVVALMRNMFPHKTRAYVSIGCLYLMSTTGMLNLGLLSMAIPGYITCCILAAILLGVDKSLYAIALSLLSLVVIGYGITSGFLSISVDAEVFNESASAWTTASIIFLVSIGSLVLCLAGLMGALMTLLSKVREQGAELMERHDQLEELVQARTQDLTQEIEVRKAREVALETSEKRFKVFAEIVADWYWETDENFTIIFAPPTFTVTKSLASKSLV